MSDTKDYTKNLKLRGPTIRSNTTVIQRGSSGGPGLVGQRSSTVRQSVTPMYSHGTLSGMSHKGVTEVITGRATEKKQMQGLNERFASYIEKVRFLEAQNKCCVNEIERLKKQKGFDVSEIKELYQQELDECRKIIDDLSGQKSKFDSVLVGLQDALDDERRERSFAENEAKDLRGKLDAVTNQIGEYEGEIATLRARINNLEEELAHVKGAHKRVSDDLTRARGELDCETQKRIDAERDGQMVEDDLRFQLNVAETEIRELKSLIDRDKTVDIRNFWKGEIQKTINDLQKEYDTRFQEMKHNYELTMDNKRRDLEAGVHRDNMERDQLREECKRLKSKIGDTNPRLAELESLCEALKRQLDLLREEYDDYKRNTDNELEKKDIDLQKVLDENENILRELQVLEDAKLSMELEIGTYRKLLDGEEQSLNTTIQSISGARSQEADNLADIIQQSS